MLTVYHFRKRCEKRNFFFYNYEGIINATHSKYWWHNNKHYSRRYKTASEISYWCNGDSPDAIEEFHGIGETVFRQLNIHFDNFKKGKFIMVRSLAFIQIYSYSHEVPKQTQKVWIRIIVTMTVKEVSKQFFFNDVKLAH